MPNKVTIPQLKRYKPRPIQRLNHARDARLVMFARLWDGTVQGTLALCKQEGVSISDTTATAYMRDHRFIDIMRAQKNEAPGSGIWTLDELKRFLTRVAAGLEADGYETVSYLEPIIPGEDDYDEKIEGNQFRRVEKQVPKYPVMRDRVRAGELLGRTQGAFLDKLEVGGDLKISIVDLLDDDLKRVVDVSEKPLAQLVDSPAQVVDKRAEQEKELAELLS